MESELSDLNFNSCDEAFGRITDSKPRRFPISGYTDSERTVVAVWYSSGTIENSGFSGFFGRDLPGDADLRLTTDAYKSLGDIKSSNAFLEAIELISSDGNTETDRSKRTEMWKSHTVEFRKEIELRFYAGMDELTANLAKHISNSNLLPTLD